MRHQSGFTLLELMVAMSIFAMLAVAGWQVFDGVNRARERAQYQADNLAALQYAYLQMQQDMGQIIPYQASLTQNSNATIANGDDAQSDDTQASPKPFMSVNTESISFARFADPDPRYQSSPSIQRIDYVFDNQQLIRRQYTSIDTGVNKSTDSISLDSVLLDNISEARWQAYVPKASSTFPDANAQDNSSLSNDAASVVDTGSALLPKGIGISFTYQEVPVTWQFALISP